LARADLSFYLHTRHRQRYGAATDSGSGWKSEGRKRHPLLNIGRLNNSNNQKDLDVCHYGPFTSFDLFTRVKALCSATFCFFTLWLSIIPANRKASLPANHRNSAGLWSSKETHPASAPAMVIRHVANTKEPE